MEGTHWYGLNLRVHCTVNTEIFQCSSQQTTGEYNKLEQSGLFIIIKYGRGGISCTFGACSICLVPGVMRVRKRNALSWTT